MKIGIFTDIHLGVKRGSEIFLESQLKFIKNQFIPQLIEKGIDTIIIPGDFFDNRLALDNRILKHVLDLFDNEFKNFTIHILVGNHDSYHENTIKVNSLRVFEFYKNVKIYETNESIILGDRKVLMCPWVTHPVDFQEYISKIEPHDICFGHFNFVNFKMFKDQEADHGLKADTFFEKFLLTISGHFHTRSEKEVNGSRIVYIGNPFHLTRSDIGDERGYAILDTDTLQLEYIENTESIKFVKYTYPQKLEESDIRNNHVDIYIKYEIDMDETAIDRYIERLESFKPAFPINKKTINTFELTSVEEQMQGTSTIELMKEWNDTQSYENKDEIYDILLDLHKDCDEKI